MLTGGWVYAAALLASFGIAAVASPAGVSGAVLLLPFQVSVLGTPSPAVTPTNLLYNVVATPGALYRYWRQDRLAAALPVCFSLARCQESSAATSSESSSFLDWSEGLALGIGGLLGGYTGARVQPRLPEAAIRRLLGLLVLVIGIRYGWLAVG